jgi:NAD(P)H-dependent flavin oxidoreductase YrpB (nitropropane dioxygenase family)
MWPRRDLLDLLEIDHPILQAPMGGESTPAMAVAVSNAGGLVVQPKRMVPIRFEKLLHKINMIVD